MKNNLKKYMEDNNLTQEQVANEIGVHKSTIKRILGTLNGHVSLFTQVKIANFLDDKEMKTSYTLDDLNTKHYSDRKNILLFNLLNNFESSIDIIEPFAGNGSLISSLDRFSSLECYDILPQNKDIVKRDTLINPPSYNKKYVVTNPPYLARNKAMDKTIFDKYNVDDLYKAFIKSIIEGNCEGGAIIIPLNFLTDENSKDIRELFFSRYRVENLNIFKCQMFDYTKYNTCSFNFFKDENGTNTVDTLIFQKRDIVLHLEINLRKKYNYRLFGEFYAGIQKRNISIDRFTNKNQSPSNISIKCIDGITEQSKIKAEYINNPTIGKQSDRTSAVIVMDKVLTKEQELEVVNLFNTFITTQREKYYNLIFTNFRENNRKRIGFDLAYNILAMCIEEVVNND